MSGDPGRLLPDVDYLLDRDKAAVGTAITASAGGDPLVDPPAFGYPMSMQVELERRIHFEKDRTQKMNEGVFLNPESGWGQIKQFMDGVFDTYKKQNDAKVIKVPKNEEEAIAQMQQMRPVQVDPNEVANIRQMATKLDQQMKAIDPRTSFWTDPRTRHYAEWLNRESGAGTAGFMESGEQPVEMGAAGRAAYVAWQGVEGIGSATTSLLHGLWDLGRQSINGMGGPDIGPSYPTNYIETEDGQLVSNGGKAPSIMDGIVMTWAHATQQNVEKFAAESGRAQEWELANRAGFAGLATSVSRLGGELVGMAPGFGAAAKVGEMTLGALTKKGLQSLGTLRLAKGVQQSDRALKIIGAMSKGVGQAAGMAGYESMTQGRVEGYGASYLHGLMMAPVLMTLGALGKKTEWFAQNRMGMPGAASKAIAGAMEGIGFGAIETTIPDLLPSAWGFVRDPNQSTFEAYMKNMLAFSMVKMGSGHTAIASPEQMQIRRGIGRAQFAEKVARGEAKPEEIAGAPVPDAAKLTELGQASMASREGKTAEERSAATKKQREIERLLDVEEFGQKPPAEVEAERVQQEGPEPIAREASERTKKWQGILAETKELIAKQRDPKTRLTDAERKRVIELMDITAREAGKDVAANRKRIRERALDAEGGVELTTDIVKLLETTKAIAKEHVPSLEGERVVERTEKPKDEPAGEDAEIAAMAKKLGISVAEMRKEMGMEEAPAELKQERKPLSYEEVLDRNPILKERVKEIPELERMIRENPEAYDTQRMDEAAAAEPRREQREPTEAERSAHKQEVERGWWERQKIAAAQAPIPAWEKQSSGSMRDNESVAKEAVRRGLFSSVDEALSDMRAHYDRKHEAHTASEDASRGAAYRRAEGIEPNVPRGTIEPVEAADLAERVGAPAGLEVRQGDRRTTAGARAGPQSLQAQPTRQIEPTLGTAPVRAADIFTEMEGRPSKKGFRIPFTSIRVGGEAADTVRVAVRGGKVEGRSTLGVFKTFQNLMRTKEGRDLAVGAHEWSHAMHRHTAAEAGGREFIAAAKQQVKDALASKDGPALDSEMREMLKDYPGSEDMPKWLQWSEAWAEWHARNLLGEVGLDKKMPALSSYMRSWLAAPQRARLREQYGRIQQMLNRYNAQGSLGRLEQSIVSGAEPLTETQKAVRPSLVRRAMTVLNKALLDDMAELKKSQERWLEAVGRKPEDVSITEDPARMFDTLAMTANKTVEHFVNRGIRLPDGSRVPGLKSVMESVSGREKEFQQFVVAVRSLELYKKGKEVQLPIQDYVESVKQLSARHPDFVDQLGNLKRWTDALVDYIAGAGNISFEDAKRIKDAYVVYVPFFRAIEGPAQHGQGRGVAERGTGLSRIKGSTYEVKDPFIALQQVARSMVAKAHQNQVTSALFKMAMGQEAGGLATIVKRTSIPTDHPLRQLLDAIEKKVDLPLDMQHELEGVFEALRQVDALNPQTITTFAQKVIPTGERNIIAFTPRLSEREVNDLVDQGAHRQTVELANNKLQWLEVDTKVYEALMGIDKMPQLPEAMQPVMQWLQAPRDVVRFFATGVAPGFVAANMLRDAMSAPLFDRAGKFRPFGGFVKLIRGAIEYHKNGEMRELYEELGVKTSSFWTEGRQRALIGEEISLWQKAKAMADTVQSWFAHPENYIRMAEFKDTYGAAKKSGKSEFEARMEALEAGREITVNFARAGIWARVLNQTIPYFNAGLQGQRKLWGQLIAGGTETKGDEAKARVQRGAILNGIANLTVPATLLWLLNRDEEWYQDLPEWRKIGYFNTKIGDQIVSVPKPFEAGTLFASLPEIMLDHLFGKNPAGMKEAMHSIAGPYLEVGNLIPAFIKPLAEVAFNRNFFTGRPLTPEWIQKANPPQEQATFYTSEVAKVMSKALNGLLSPTEIEALTGGYTAGAATKVMRILDEISGLKDHPGIGLNPFQRFSSQQEHGQSSFVDQLYTIGTKLEQNEDTLTAQERGFKSRVDTAKRQISELRKRYRAGEISQKEAERRSYELARPLVERSER